MSPRICRGILLAAPLLVIPTLVTAQDGEESSRWPLPSRCAACLDVEFGGHAKPVAALAWSPDGKTVATAGEDGRLLLWDVKRTNVVGGPIPWFQPLTAVTYSSDGRWLIAGDRVGNVRVWDIAANKNVAQLQTSGVRVTGLLISDGWLIALQGKSVIGRWELPSFRPLHFRNPGLPVADRHTDGPAPAWLESELNLAEWTVAPNGQLLAAVSSSGPMVGLWEVSSGGLRQAFVGHRTTPMCLAFSPDGRWLATVADGKVMIWDVVGKPHQPEPLTEAALDELWRLLACPDPALAGDAIAKLAAEPAAALPYLKKRLEPVPQFTMRQFQARVQDLDHQRYAVRQKAHNELCQQGAHIRPWLEETMAAKHSLELCKRVELILEAIPAPGERERIPDRLRRRRALEALGFMDGSAARALLRELNGN